MPTTRQIVAQQVDDYLHQRTSLESLVDWAEREMMEGEFDSRPVRDAIARLGLADVRAFGLTWDDCNRLLYDLGFEAQVKISLAGR